MTKNIVIYVLIAIIAILVIVCASGRGHNVNNYIPGFWSADPEFLQTAGLTNAYVLFEPDDDGSMSGLLTMVGKNNVLSNQHITMTKLSPHGIGEGMYKYKNVNVEYSSTEIMPTKLNIDVDINAGLMVLSDSTKVYAVFIKDNEATNYSR